MSGVFMRHEYTITKQYTRGPQVPLNERFYDFNQAKTFVEKKLTEEAKMNVKVVYRIFEDEKLHSEYDETKIDTSVKQESESSQGKGSTASFRPTPVSTTLRPPGSAQNWVVDKDEKKDKK